MAAMQTIREAKIVIHLEQGRVELKAPDLTKVLQDQQRQVDLTRKLTEETARLAAAQQAASSAASSGGGSGSSGGGGRSGGANEERDRERILQILKEEEQAVARLRSSMAALAGAAMQVGEGFFRIGRAAVLLGASEDSLQKMIKSLAEVQAYWDIIAGATMIVQGMVNAQKAVAAAQAVYVTALASSTLATQAFMVATIEATAAFLAFAAPIIATVAVIVAVVAALAAAWDYFTESQAEAMEAQQERAQQIKEDSENAARVMTEYLKMMDDRIARERELTSLVFDRMTAEEQQANVSGRVSRGMAAGGRGQTIVDEGLFVGEARKQALESERAAAIDAIRALQQLDDATRRRKESQIEILNAQLKSVEAAEKELRIAKEKEQAFRVQFGMLQQFEREQLKAIADRLRAGQDISEFEEQFLREKGGDPGKRIADARAGRRGGAAGADDVFAGIPDAMDTAAKSVDELEKVLADLLAELKKGGSAIEAKARIEAEKKELQKQYEDFFKGNTEAIRKLAAVVEDLNKKIDAVALATQVNG